MGGLAALNPCTNVQWMIVKNIYVFCVWFVVQRNRLFEKAFPEPDFKYFSKLKALYLSEKAM